MSGMFFGLSVIIMIIVLSGVFKNFSPRLYNDWFFENVGQCGSCCSNNHSIICRYSIILIIVIISASLAFRLLLLGP